jgi:hypothetical protein
VSTSTTCECRRRVLRARDARGVRRARNACAGRSYPRSPEIREVGPTTRPGWLSRSSGNCQLSLGTDGTDTIKKEVVIGM